MGKIFGRALRATLFDRKAFTEAFFRDDSAADGAIVVSAVAALTYIGTLVWHGILGSFSLGGLIQIVLAGVMGWLILALATWFVATRLFSARGRPQMMMGLHGLAPLPLLLEIPANEWVAAIGLIWYLAILVLATREMGDLSPRNAGVSGFIGFALAALIRSLFGVPFALFSAIF